MIYNFRLSLANFYSLGFFDSNFVVFPLLFQILDDLDIFQTIFVIESLYQVFLLEVVFE